jgi:L-aspartate oxidase
VYGRTTNPTVATGDGIAMAYRAGAAIRDLEFVQFHPTGLAVDGQETVLLVTEALRGEGAYLRNKDGERFMERYDPQAELAARDVVVRGMVGEMRRERADYVYLDATHLDPEMLAKRFPTATAGLAEYGFRLATDRIPVAPVCHYFVGGVVADVWGRTTVPGLYASGEVSAPACTAPWPRTRSSRGWSSRIVSCATSTATSAVWAKTCVDSASSSPKRHPVPTMPAAWWRSGRASTL